jgi:hypothetical protein
MPDVCKHSIEMDTIARNIVRVHGYIPLLVSSQDIFNWYTTDLVITCCYSVDLQDLLDVIQWDTIDVGDRILRYTTEINNVIEYINTDPLEYMLDTYVRAASISLNWKASANVATHMISACRNTSVVCIGIEDSIRTLNDYTCCTIEDSTQYPQYIYCSKPGNKYVITLTYTASEPLASCEKRLCEQVIELTKVLAVAHSHACNITGILVIGHLVVVYSVLVTTDSMNTIRNQTDSIVLSLVRYPLHSVSLDLRSVPDRNVLYSILSILFHDMY